jgi:hypothetical protein
MLNILLKIFSVICLVFLLGATCATPASAQDGDTDGGGEEEVQMRPNPEESSSSRFMMQPSSAGMDAITGAKTGESGLPGQTRGPAGVPTGTEKMGVAVENRPNPTESSSSRLTVQPVSPGSGVTAGAKPGTSGMPGRAKTPARVPTGAEKMGVVIEEKPNPTAIGIAPSNPATQDLMKKGFKPQPEDVSKEKDAEKQRHE